MSDAGGGFRLPTGAEPARKSENYTLLPSTSVGEAGQSVAFADSEAAGRRFLQWAAEHNLTGEDFGFLQWAHQQGLKAEDFAKAGGGKAGGSAPAGGGGAPAPTILSEGDLEQKIRDHYPAFAWLLDDPEIRDLLFTAEREQWTADVFQARLTGTNWWKTHSPSMRQWDTLAHLDPAAAGQRMQQRQAQIWDSARRMGIDIDSDLTARLSRQSLRFGLNEEQLNDMLVGQLRFSSEPKGQVGADMAGLKRMAAQYHTPMGDGQAFAFARRIAAGELTLEGMVGYFRRQAKSRYSHLADQIDAGFTPEEIFEPQRQAIAQTLEMSPAEIDFVKNPLWSKVTGIKDSKGRMRPMTMSETLEFARGQDRFWDTAAGNQAEAEVATLIGRELGVLA